MTLDPSALTTSPGLPGAGGRDYPGSYAGAAQQWAAAIGAWATPITPPSATVAAARDALEADLASAFALGAPGAAAAMDVALSTFALAVGVGMNPPPPAAPVFIVTPPPSPVGFASLLAPPFATTRDEGVARIAARLVAWMATGTATLVLPPGTVTPWA